MKTVAAASERGVDLLLALRVGAHAGEVGAGLDLRGHQDRREGGGDGDDDVGLGAEAVEGDGFEGQAGFGGDVGEAGEGISGLRFQPRTRSKGRWRSAARSWKADWWPAPIMPRTWASSRARWRIETAEAAAVRAAVR